jgi:hypothetical protein
MAVGMASVLRSLGVTQWLRREGEAAFGTAGERLLTVLGQAHCLSPVRVTYLCSLHCMYRIQVLVNPVFRLFALTPLASNGKS